MSFAPTAIAAWIPPTTWWTTAVMFFRFARGDSQAKLWRPKVSLIFARYGLLALLFAVTAITQNFFLWGVLIGLTVSYSYWSISKNYRHAKQGWWWLPVLQLTADLSVMLGTLAGLKTRLLKQ